MDEHRLFSLDEANATIPHLSAAFERLERLREKITEAYRQMTAGGLRVEDEDEIHALDPSELGPELRSVAARFKQMVREVERTVGAIHAMGCEIKDLRMGLVDFYSVIDGEPVYLCWQYGEDEVAFYHSLQGGFAGRQPLPGRQSTGIVYN
ncbi:MAG: DUF2203 domain-containing protein [Deltaproteobacteria bacterium]|nr:DUF2203 domain-containing protein [Deltaproteobacteria bacterium]